MLARINNTIAKADNIQRGRRRRRLVIGGAILFVIGGVGIGASLLFPPAAPFFGASIATNSVGLVSALVGVVAPLGRKA